jgi:hypothetical protein
MIMINEHPNHSLCHACKQCSVEKGEREMDTGGGADLVCS